MLTNIIDRRKHTYRFAKVNAVVEPTCHDNSLADSDKVEPGYAGIGYDEREHVTVAAAVAWANSFTEPTTLFLYDENDGIYGNGNVASRKRDLLLQSHFGLLGWMNWKLRCLASNHLTAHKVNGLTACSTNSPLSPRAGLQ